MDLRLVTLRNRYRTISESLRQSQIEFDALEQGGIVESVFVDLTEDNKVKRIKTIKWTYIKEGKMRDEQTNNKTKRWTTCN